MGPISPISSAQAVGQHLRLKPFLEAVITLVTGAVVFQYVAVHTGKADCFCSLLTLFNTNCTVYRIFKKKQFRWLCAKKSVASHLGQDASVLEVVESFV